MRAYFKLKGMNRANGDIFATLELLDKEETFPSKIHGSDIDKEKLWRYAEGNWGNMLANVRFDKLDSGGHPINPTMMFIKHK